MHTENYVQINLRDRFCYIELEAGEIFQRKDFDKTNHLIFLLSGDTEIIYGGLRPQLVRGGSMVFLTPLDNCIGKTLSRVEMIVLGLDSLVFSCDKHIFQNLTPYFSLLKYEFSELDIRPVLGTFLELVKVYLNRKEILPEIYPQKIKELFILLRSFYSAEELAMLFYPMLGKNLEFKRIVMDNYPQVKNATELADLCGYSPGVFQRKFKEVFGESVYQWMQRQKAEQIKYRLMTEEISLKELSEELHFASPAHLNKFCKIWFGMTPSEVRQTFLLKKNLR